MLSPTGKLRAFVSPTAVYLLLSLWATWPLATVASDHVAWRFFLTDVLLVLWIPSWSIHALFTQPLHLFDANILHPLPNSLALSEHLLGQLPLFAPVYYLTGNPVLAWNLNVLVGFVLAGVFMHAVIHRWTGSSLAAFAAATAFTVAPWRLETYDLQHLLSIQYLPLVIFALDRAVTARSLSWGFAAGGLIALQMMCSYYFLYLVVVLVGCYFVADLSVRGIRDRGRAWAALSAAVAVPALVVTPLSLPYLEARAAGYFDNAVQKVLLSPEIGAEIGAKIAAYQAAIGSPDVIVRGQIGLGTAGLALLALIAVASALRRGQHDELVRASALALTAAVAFGAAVGRLGLAGWLRPYAWMEAAIPGFSLMRVPSRFGILASFCLSGLAGLGVAAADDVARRVARTTTERVILMCVLGGFAAAAVLSPLVQRNPPRLLPIPVQAQVPAVYRWLARNGKGAPLLELPGVPARPSFLAHGRADAMTMYFSTYHWLPTINGYSGYIPDFSHALQEQAALLPDPEALRRLVSCAQLRWILISNAQPTTQRAWSNLDGVALRETFPRLVDDYGNASRGTDLLYEVSLSPGAPCPFGPIPAAPQPAHQPARHAHQSAVVTVRPFSSGKGTSGAAGLEFGLNTGPAEEFRPIASVVKIQKDLAKERDVSVHNQVYRISSHAD